ncbi:YiiD C-terminal domain-containing protein [Pseudomonas sp. S75]|uniref:YiiD C-terminal domain-containing protein n=1 Tax=unclassified Pseudomonas TaxID=196821 RepID=UPI0019052028|nr:MULTISPECIES: YiiD C-terminal domain-containing protein [unclassified Pseudomonas]MBJ9978244.1 YiiD C-terminal domain-containing protein [Pseudomonas sp. S30]MBK0156126.1 YiiD C-terminal domain-containing protein [Pseudomonas sp. S75]
MSDASRYLQDILHRDIPLTAHMGLEALDWQAQRLRLHVPLAPNVNHKNTMFGGSLYCAAVLVGWGWLHLRLRELGIDDGHIVIQEGQVGYPLPVTGAAIASCSAPPEEDWERFIKLYHRRGRARLTLHTTVHDHGSEQPAVLFSGQYVLHR